MLEVFRDGPAPMISAICRDIGLTQTIDAMATWDDSQCTLSPGLRVEAIIINTLMNRRPLYRLEQFFAGMDVSKLFGPGVTASALNDDAMGRALDKLAEAGAGEVYGTVALQAVCHEGVSIDVLHADTTSVSVQGAYTTNGQDDDLWLTFGHSKDQRPDLKQFMYGLGVTKDQVPVCGDVLHGNTSDKAWNLRMIKQVRERWRKAADMVYVADSSLVSGPNLQALREQGLRFISRLPATFSLAGELKDRAWEEGNWQHLGALSQRRQAAVYRRQTYTERLNGELYRFIVIHSSQLDGRKAKSMERRLGAAERELEQAMKELARRKFACEPDAHEAWRDFMKEKRDECFQCTYTVRSQEQLTKRAVRGRPPQGYVSARERVFSLVPAMSRDEDRIADLKARASCFVLITNILSDPEWPDAAIVREYKEQTVVEQHFAFIKNPKIVGPIYLKNPARIHALAYVFLMAVLVYSLIQRRVRLALRDSGKPIEVYDKRSSLEPTGRSILEHFSSVNVVLLAGVR